MNCEDVRHKLLASARKRDPPHAATRSLCPNCHEVSSCSVFCGDEFWPPPVCIGMTKGSAPVIDLEPAARRTALLAGRVTDDQLTAPTPCPGYAVRNMLGHLIGLSLAFRDAGRRSPRLQVRSSSCRSPAAVRSRGGRGTRFRRPGHGDRGHARPARTLTVGASLGRRVTQAGRAGEIRGGESELRRASRSGARVCLRLRTAGTPRRGRCRGSVRGNGGR